MVGFVVVVSAIVFAVIVPIIVLIKYYSPKNYNIFMNIFWIIVAILTWPLIPIIIAARRHDKMLLSFFWISFLVMAVAGWYWSVLNVQTIIQIQEQMLKGA